MSDNIPFDIQSEIIKKVPVKSLLRFRSLSKQWKFFIDSADFIASYGSRHTQPRRLLLRYQLTGYISRIQIEYDSFIDDVSFPLKEGSFPHIPWRVCMLNDSNVIGSSCGLWAFHDYRKDTVAIWNPSIRKSVCIGVPCVSNNTFKKMSSFGFGVCPSTYDPTIVVMSYSSGILENIATYKWQAEVFSMTSKTWKMIPSSNLPRESKGLTASTQVAIDRFIFWGAYDRIVANDREVLKNLILSFDLITHEFKEIHLPFSITNHKFQEISLSELNESLVVCAYTNEVNHGRVYGVWMMVEEAGVMASFTKLFNIKIPDSSLSVTLLGFRKSGQPIMETGKKDQDFAKEFAESFADDFEGGFDEAVEYAESLDFCGGGAEDFFALEVYEPCSEQINDLGIKGVRESLFMCPYMETLLLADHSDGCIISDDR